MSAWRRTSWRPTKTNMMKVKRDLGFAIEGWELLDQKRKILVVELMGLIDRAVEAQEKVEERLAVAFKAPSTRRCCGWAAGS